MWTRFKWLRIGCNCSLPWTRNEPPSNFLTRWAIINLSCMTLLHGVSYYRSCTKAVKTEIKQLSLICEEGQLLRDVWNRIMSWTQALNQGPILATGAGATSEIRGSPIGDLYEEPCTMDSDKTLRVRAKLRCSAPKASVPLQIISSSFEYHRCQRKQVQDRSLLNIHENQRSHLALYASYSTMFQDIRQLISIIIIN
jgi:hypothetical protein